MYGLASLLRTRGDLEEAEAWYQRAADGGDAQAFFGLGFLLSKKGDLDGATVWYRRAADTGDVRAMDNLGFLLKNRGDPEEAEEWYKRAAEAGSTYAVDGLAELQRKIDHSDRMLDSIAFATFGWQLVQNGDGNRKWEGPGTSLRESFFDFPPDFPSLDLQEIREAMMEFQGLVESPTFRIEDLELPAHLQKCVPAEFPEQVSLLDITRFGVQQATCLLFETRHRSHGDVHYSTVIMVLFAGCFWSFGLEVEEDGSFVGEREGAVARKILEGNTTVEAPIEELSPYDRRWDGLVPLEHDPLTRMRLLVARLRESLALDSDLAELEGFSPDRN